MTNKEIEQEAAVERINRVYADLSATERINLIKCAWLSIERRYNRK